MKSLAELKLENQNLRSLLDTNRLIHSPMPLNKLLRVIMNVAKKVMRAEAATLMLVDEAAQELVYEVALGEKGEQIKKMFRLKLGQGVAGWVAQKGEPALIEDAAKDPRFYAAVDKKSGFKTRSMICVPLSFDAKVIGILQALNPTHKKCFDAADLNLFQDFAAQAAVALTQVRWHEAQLQEQKLNRDLDVAQDIQKNFLSDETFAAEGFHFSACYKPAQTIGGDFYDCIPLNSDRGVILLGDVSGKGISGALYMVKTLTEFRNLVWRFYPDLKLIFSSLNRLLQAKATFGMFVTAVGLAIDRKVGEVAVCNAGHLPPLFYSSKNGNVQFLQKASEPPLGILKELSYSSKSYPIEKGDQILLYSDGLTEARNPNQIEFGASRLKKVFKSGIDLRSQNKVLPFILKKVKAFSPGQERDDQTAVWVGIQ